MSHYIGPALTSREFMETQNFGCEFLLFSYIPPYFILRVRHHHAPSRIMRYETGRLDLSSCAGRAFCFYYDDLGGPRGVGWRKADGWMDGAIILSSLQYSSELRLSRSDACMFCYYLVYM